MRALTAYGVDGLESESKGRNDPTLLQQCHTISKPGLDLLCYLGQVSALQQPRASRVIAAKKPQFEKSLQDCQGEIVPQSRKGWSQAA